MPGLERALTRSGESVKSKMNVISEPEDKPDAATHVVVNGPEDAPFDWHAIDWRRVEDDVRRLRQRIFTASKAGDLAKVRRFPEVDAPFTREHAPERAAGDRAQRRSSDRRSGRRGGAHPKGQSTITGSFCATVAAQSTPIEIGYRPLWSGSPRATNQTICRKNRPVSLLRGWLRIPVAVLKIPSRHGDFRVSGASRKTPGDMSARQRSSAISGCDAGH